MTRSTRFLSSNTTSSSSLDQPEAQPPEAVAVESDFVVILAALLCALICVLGLFSVARCAWLRRGSTNTRGNQSQAAANKGIKKKVIETLPKFVYKKEDKGKTTGHNNDNNNNNINSNININIISLADCAICLAEYTEGDEIRVLPQCGHGFHVECIDTWLNSHSSCPSCRQVLVMSRCRKCGEFPAVFAGESSTSVERKGEQGQRQRQQQGHDDNNNNNNNGSCSSDYLP